MMTEYKKYFWFYLPVIFYGRQFNITTREFVSGWHIFNVGVGYNSWSFQVVRGSVVLRANKQQYDTRTLMGMSLLRRMFVGGVYGR